MPSDSAVRYDALIDTYRSAGMTARSASAARLHASSSSVPIPTAAASANHCGMGHGAPPSVNLASASIPITRCPSSSTMG